MDGKKILSKWKRSHREERVMDRKGTEHNRLRIIEEKE
jgi:hypothetical protein